MIDTDGFRLAREADEVIEIARFTVAGEPVSKARARFTGKGYKKRAYTPEKTVTAEAKIGWAFRRAARGHRADDTSAFGIAAVFYHGTRQRRDVDNMIKLIADGLNKIAWADDSQVVEVSGRRGYDHPDKARTEVLIYRVGDLETGPKIKCEECGTEFVTYPSWVGKRRFCSRECGYANRTRHRMITCQTCGEKFDGAKIENPPKFCSVACKAAAGHVPAACLQCGGAFLLRRSYKGRPLCSDQCRAAYWRDHRKSAAKGTCATCGGPTSKKEYTNCRPCSYKVGRS